MTVSNTKSQRVWDKTHCCVFCMKLYPKLPRHFEQVHKDELEVAKALSYPKKSQERRLLLDSLRYKGDFAHNTEVLKAGKGVLIPWRRPSVQTDSSDYLPCEDCLGWFMKTDLWKHRKKCQHAKSKCTELETNKPRRGRHQASSAALLPVSTEAQSQMRSLILDTMANDKIATVARTDNLIVQFGRKLFSKNVHEKHQHQYIKQKMREVARFLMCMREKNRQVRTMEDCINPFLFSAAVEAVKELCGYNAEDGKYTVPSLALKIGHSLGKCAKYLRSQAIQTQDAVLKFRAEEYRDVLESDWSSEVSAQALATLHQSTFNKTPRLPLAHDLRELNLYLSKEAESRLQSLEDSPSSDTWRQLAEVTLTQLVLFNRRRGGETERILCSQYSRGLSQSSGRMMQEEVAAALSPFERSLAKKLARVEIRGKRGRKVPVLITKTHKKQIDLLNQQRSSCGVLETNDFLFARTGETKTPLRTSDVLRKFTKKCKAIKQPEWITSTSLRKHVATVSQLLNLKDNEMDILAGFMGHDIRVHREVYRLPENTLQLAKVSKILLQMENGNIQKYKGMSLDEIQMDEDETIGDDEMDHDEGQQTPIMPVDQPNMPNDCDGPTQGGISGLNKDSSDTVKRPKTGKDSRRPWTREEKDAVKRQLGKFIRLGQVPGKWECEVAISEEHSLSRRPWQQIKFCVKNINSTKKGMK